MALDRRGSPGWIFTLYMHLMPTTVHLPDDLLERLDARAKALDTSRNRLIVETLTQALDGSDSWSPELKAALGSWQPDPQGDQAVDEMMAAIVAARRRKAAAEL